MKNNLWSNPLLSLFSGLILLALAIFLTLFCSSCAGPETVRLAKWAEDEKAGRVLFSVGAPPLTHPVMGRIISQDPRYGSVYLADLWVPALSDAQIVSVSRTDVCANFSVTFVKDGETMTWSFYSLRGYISWETPSKLNFCVRDIYFSAP